MKYNQITHKQLILVVKRTKNDVKTNNRNLMILVLFNIIASNLYLIKNVFLRSIHF